MNKSIEKETVQNRKKGTERGQTKYGKTHVDYWAPRIRKRSFVGRDGQVVTIPDYQVRLKHLGREAYFNLKTANAADAAGMARDRYVYLVANGWDATLAKYKPKPEEPTSKDLTIQEFGKKYEETLDVVEYAPQKPTALRYFKNLEFICRLVKVKRLANLTVAKIREFKTKYLKKRRLEGGDECSIKITCNTYLRSAAAIFSKQMLSAYADMDFEVTNPFVGMSLRRIEIKPYTPMCRDLLDKIWENAAKLRDGDPNAPVPVKEPRAKRGEGPKKRYRWKEPDWRKPHPEAFMILLLELGLGMRRNEVDKAVWVWFFTDAKGRRYIEITATPYFTVKGKKRRIIPVESVLWDTIHSSQQNDSPFIVPGRQPKEYAHDNVPINKNYRCEEHHRTLIAWLRKQGINDDKPCHKLRKEFGSYVATSFGLFAAQRLLGHSAPSVTEAYYAGLTNLPELSHAKVPPQKAA